MVKDCDPGNRGLKFFNQSGQEKIAYLLLVSQYESLIINQLYGANRRCKKKKCNSYNLILKCF